MKRHSTLVSRWLLPGLFFGYAALANASMLAFPHREESPGTSMQTARFDGSLTRAIEAVYESRLPHHAPSVGILGAIRYLAFGEGRKGVVVGRGGWLFTDEEFAGPADARAAAEDAADRIAEIGAQLARRGIRLIVVPLPAKADVYGDQLRSAPARLRDLYRELAAALHGRGVLTVDARDSLLARKAARAMFLKTDTHWSPAGAAAVAKVTAARIGATSKPESFLLVPGKRIVIAGDLTKFITSENYMRLAGLDHERIEPNRAVPAAGTRDVGDLFGSDERVPIVVTGTSYSANERWGFVEELKAVAGADVLNLAEEGRGPVEPMRSLLAGDRLSRHKPEVVVWEFPIRYLARKEIWDVPSRTSQSRSHQQETRP